MPLLASPRLLRSTNKGCSLALEMRSQWLLRGLANMFFCFFLCVCAGFVSGEKKKSKSRVFLLLFGRDKVFHSLLSFLTRVKKAPLPWRCLSHLPEARLWYSAPLPSVLEGERTSKERALASRENDSRGMRDLHPQPMAAAPGQSVGLLLQQNPPRLCMKKSASAVTLLGGGTVAASRYLLQEELGRGASGQVRGLGELKEREQSRQTLAAT